MVNRKTTIELEYLQKSWNLAQSDVFSNSPYELRRIYAAIILKDTERSMWWKLRVAEHYQKNPKGLPENEIESLKLRSARELIPYVQLFSEIASSYAPDLASIAETTLQDRLRASESFDEILDIVKTEILDKEIDLGLQRKLESED